jgi:hypothetical protein
MDIQYFYNEECWCETTFNVFIDNELYIFPNHCLESGGVAFIDDNYKPVIEKGPWRIQDWPNNFPEDRKLELLKRINLDLEQGCCGACIEGY